MVTSGGGYLRSWRCRCLDLFTRGRYGAPWYHSYGLARLGGFAELGQSGSLQPISRSPAAACARRYSAISSVDVDRWRINRRSAQTSSSARRKTAIVGGSKGWIMVMPTGYLATITTR